MKEINWTSVRHDVRYLGAGITLAGVAMGFLAFLFALSGFMFGRFDIFRRPFSRPHRVLP